MTVVVNENYGDFNLRVCKNTGLSRYTVYVDLYSDSLYYRTGFVSISSARANGRDWLNKLCFTAYKELAETHVFGVDDGKL